MRFVSIAVFCLGLVSAVCCTSDNKASVEECEGEFVNWLAGQTNAYDSSELFQRFTRFCKKLDQVRDHNAKDLPYKRALNKFAAYTDDEYKQLLGYRPPQDDGNSTLQEFRTEAVPTLNWTNPATVIDWVTAGAVNPIKDQGSCGSCWSFAAAGAMESALKIKYPSNPLVSLAEQQMVDCSRNGNYGCNGGNYIPAWQWVQSNGGMTNTASYPYVARQSTCRAASKVATVTGVRDLRSSSESGLLAALEQGPVSVAIQAASSCFQQYRSGVLTPQSCACGNRLDHAVILVGAGTDAATGLKYWKIRNSWGTWWGDKGYIKLQRALTTTGGMCGLQMYPAQPIV